MSLSGKCGAEISHPPLLSAPLPLQQSEADWPCPRCWNRTQGYWARWRCPLRLEFWNSVPLVELSTVLKSNRGSFSQLALSMVLKPRTLCQMSLSSSRYAELVLAVVWLRLNLSAFASERSPISACVSTPCLLWSWRTGQPQLLCRGAA